MQNAGVKNCPGCSFYLILDFSGFNWESVSKKRCVCVCFLAPPPKSSGCSSYHLRFGSFSLFVYVYLDIKMCACVCVLKRAGSLTMPIRSLTLSFALTCSPSPLLLCSPSYFLPDHVTSCQRRWLSGRTAGPTRPEGATGPRMPRGNLSVFPAPLRILVSVISEHRLWCVCVCVRELYVGDLCSHV